MAGEGSCGSHSTTVSSSCSSCQRRIWCDFEAGARHSLGKQPLDSVSRTTCSPSFSRCSNIWHSMWLGIAQRFHKHFECLCRRPCRRHVARMKGRHHRIRQHPRGAFTRIDSNRQRPSIASLRRPKTLQIAPFPRVRLWGRGIWRHFVGFRLCSNLVGGCPPRCRVHV